MSAFRFLITLDYGGICLLIMGSSYPLIVYAMSCPQIYFWRNVFALLITSSCMTCFTIMMIPKFADIEYRTFRGTMFVILGISAAAPFFYIGTVKDQSVFSRHDFMPFIVGGAIYILGALFYMNRVPERCSPGKYDYCGASHQIFHVCVVIGALVHFYESMNLFNHRHEMHCPIDFPVAS
mmetsp:Transcript_8303/g.13879  ORF Transcript_8303/g.13879 Transcript_8303/m.13879 type:complete len:180 (-) Transcript_8303:53-592(-)